MKGKLITINMALSFAGLSIDTNKSPLWAVVLIIAWFIASALLMNYTSRKGWFKSI